MGRVSNRVEAADNGQRKASATPQNKEKKNIKDTGGKQDKTLKGGSPRPQAKKEDASAPRLEPKLHTEGEAASIIQINYKKKHQQHDQGLPSSHTPANREEAADNVRGEASATPQKKNNKHTGGKQEKTPKGGKTKPQAQTEDASANAVQEASAQCLRGPNAEEPAAEVADNVRGKASATPQKKNKKTGGKQEKTPKGEKTKPQAQTEGAAANAVQETSAQWLSGPNAEERAGEAADNVRAKASATPHRKNKKTGGKQEKTPQGEKTKPQAQTEGVAANAVQEASAHWLSGPNAEERPGEAADNVRAKASATPHRKNKKTGG